MRKKIKWDFSELMRPYEKLSKVVIFSELFWNANGNSLEVFYYLVYLIKMWTKIENWKIVLSIFEVFTNFRILYTLKTIYFAKWVTFPKITNGPFFHGWSPCRDAVVSAVKSKPLFTSQWYFIGWKASRRVHHIGFQSAREYVPTWNHYVPCMVRYYDWWFWQGRDE